MRKYGSGIPMESGHVVAHSLAERTQSDGQAYVGKSGICKSLVRAFLKHALI